MYRVSVTLILILFDNLKWVRGSQSLLRSAVDKVQSFCNQIRALLSNLMSKQTTKGKNVTIKRFDTNSGKVCNGRNSEFQKASVRL